VCNICDGFQVWLTSHSWSSYIRIRDRLFLAVTNYAKSKQLLANLVQKPVQSLAVMAGYGVWKSGDASAGCKAPGKSAVSLGKCHPNSIARSLSSTPR
jgi:hypothetical protein